MPARLSEGSNIGISEGISKGNWANLAPGAGIAVYEQLHASDQTANSGYAVYLLLASIKAAMRSRAVDHKRSAVRGETPSASAVSDVENPAK